MRKSKIVERLSPGVGEEWLTCQHEAIYKLIFSRVKNKKILDAGCGCGLGSWTWLKLGAQSIDAFDISSSSLNFANKHYYSKKINYQKLDFNKQIFPKKNYYDLACSIEIIEHLEKYEFYLKNINLSLNKNGLLFITTPNSNLSSGDNKYHIREFKPNELQKLLSNTGFTVVEKYDLSINSISRIGGAYIPNFLVNFIKNFPLYNLLVNILCKPTISKGSAAGETIMFLAKKV